MQGKNIFNQFKMVLGQYCAVNQFVELATRCFVSEHGEEIEDKDAFITLATTHAVTLTDYNVKTIAHDISKGYIVHIHRVFETFLKDACEQLRKYGTNEFREKQRDESWLECVVKNIMNGGSLPPDQQMLSDLCEYYRFVRNSAVHDLHTVMNYASSAYAKLNTHHFKTDAKFKRLEAPNEPERISFDDFVMFARSCVELASYLFDHMPYDYGKLLDDAPKKSVAQWRNQNPKRRKQAIALYLKTKCNVSTIPEAELQSLSDRVMAQ